MKTVQYFNHNFKNINRIYTAWVGHIGIYTNLRSEWYGPQAISPCSKAGIYTDIARPISVYSVYYTETASFCIIFLFKIWENFNIFKKNIYYCKLFLNNNKRSGGQLASGPISYIGVISDRLGGQDITLYIMQMGQSDWQISLWGIIINYIIIVFFIAIIEDWIKNRMGN